MLSAGYTGISTTLTDVTLTATVNEATAAPAKYAIFDLIASVSLVVCPTSPAVIGGDRMAFL